MKNFDSIEEALNVDTEVVEDDKIQPQKNQLKKWELVSFVDILQTFLFVSFSNEYCILGFVLEKVVSVFVE